MAQIAFRVDGRAAAGGGHQARCLALAQAIVPAGMGVQFLAREDDLLDEQALSQAGVSWRHLPAGHGAGEEVDADSTMAALGPGDPRIPLVLDHYGLGLAWERRVGRIRPRLLVLDDAPVRPHECEALWDAGADAQDAAEYGRIVPAHCRLMLGPRHALLRTEISRQRPGLRRRFSSVRRVLVFFGSADRSGWASRATHAVREAVPGAAIDVVIGMASDRKDALAREFGGTPSVTVHVQTSRMAELTAQADLAIGAGGTATWERCCLGLPAILLITQPNQERTASQAHRAGAALSLGYAESLGPGRLVDEIRALAASPEAREAMSLRGQKLVDGVGPHRVRNALLPPELRPAVPGDKRMLWEWANDPAVRSNAFQSDSIPWADHERWFARRLGDPLCRIYIGSVLGRPFGQVRFEPRERAAHVDISIAAACRNLRLGVPLLSAAVAEYSAACPGLPILAQVKDVNVASIRLFESAGFLRLPDAGDGIVRLNAPESSRGAA